MAEYERADVYVEPAWAVAPAGPPTPVAAMILVWNGPN
jgi:hypothetical protein